MDICSDDHDEICFTGRHCPCCEMLETIDGLNEELESLQTEVKTLEKEIESHQV